MQNVDSISSYKMYHNSKVVSEASEIHDVHVMLPFSAHTELFFPSSVIFPFPLSDKQVRMVNRSDVTIRRRWVVWKSRVSEGLAVMWFSSLAQWQLAFATPLWLRGQACKSWFWFTAHPRSSPVWIDLSKATSLSLGLYRFPAWSLILCGYLLGECALLSFSPSFFPPAASVCSLNRGDVLACLQKPLA